MRICMERDYFTALLDSIAPFALAEEWDNAGLLIEGNSKRVSKVMVALEPSWNVLDETVKQKADCLITHHPLFFNLPNTLKNSENPIVKKVLFVVRNNINYYALHTNFDSSVGGANDILADLLGIDSRLAIEPSAVLETNRQKGSVAGLGRIGKLRQPMILSELAEYTKKCFKVKNLRLAGAEKKEVSKVAVCSGSGGDFWEKSLKMGADVLVTGDVKYHQAQEAKERGLSFLDVGHFGPERLAMDIFADILRKKLPSNMKILLSENEEEPFSAFI